jgi:Arylsulfatase A and related enzymes
MASPNTAERKLQKWETLSPDEKKLFIVRRRFCAYTAYTDHEIGRVIQAVQDMGKLDNTLIIFIAATMARARKAPSSAPRTIWPRFKASIFQSRSS